MEFGKGKYIHRAGTVCTMNTEHLIRPQKNKQMTTLIYGLSITSDLERYGAALPLTLQIHHGHRMHFHEVFKRSADSQIAQY